MMMMMILCKYYDIWNEVLHNTDWYLPTLYCVSPYENIYITTILLLSWQRDDDTLQIMMKK